MGIGRLFVEEVGYGAAERMLFAGTYGAFGKLFDGRGEGPHLHENEFSSLPGNKVDFVAAFPPALKENFIPFLAEVGGG